MQDGRGPTPPSQGSQEGSNPSRTKEWEGRMPLPKAWRWWHSATLSHSGVPAVSLTLKPKGAIQNNQHPDNAGTYATPCRESRSPNDSIWRVPDQRNARRRSHHSRNWLKTHPMRACLWKAENATRFPKNASRFNQTWLHLCVCCCSRAAAATVNCHVLDGL